MIGNLVRRREQTENEAMEQTDLHTCRTPARLPRPGELSSFLAAQAT